MKNIYNKAEKTIGGLKFAVTIILVFAVLMVVGTFVESWYGTDYANRLIYKTTLFMGIQFCMFLSIIFATLIRLPIKKRLHGFYVIHTGLITIGIGSYVTYVAGIDGTIHLMPNTPTRQLVLNEDVIEIVNTEDNKRATLNLPYTPFQKDLNVTYKDIKIESYLPFADNEISWEPQRTPTDSDNTHSTSYTIANPNVAEDFILSLHPEAYEFKASMSMGLLNMTYLPYKMGECFKKDNPSGLIIWDSRSGSCRTIEELKIPIRRTSTDKRFFAVKEDKTVYSFIPDISPWALDSDLKPIQDAPIRVFSKNLFIEKPHLFLMGSLISFYNKEEKKWIMDSFETKKKIELPWMGFELTMNKHSLNELPVYIPFATTPIQKNSALIKGLTRAARINVRGQKYWVTNERPVSLLVDGKKIDIYLTKKSFLLPFELTLSRFKMDKDPGTNNPASYESFVSLFADQKNTEFHVYMNNPMKYDGFTFYQASYNQDEQTGAYSSTLSVNVDQGRFIKYLGSLLLVFGAIWHFIINKRITKKDNDILGLKSE